LCHFLVREGREMEGVEVPIVGRAFCGQSHVELGTPIGLDEVLHDNGKMLGVAAS
jgi:hypothetical protein